MIKKSSKGAEHVAAKRILTIFLAGLFIPAFFAALFIGRYSLPPADVFGMFGAWLGVSGSLADWPDAAIVVLFQVRLPRLLMALIVGSALAGSGTALQGVMRNPLVEPLYPGLVCRSILWRCPGCRIFWRRLPAASAICFFGWSYCNFYSLPHGQGTL